MYSVFFGKPKAAVATPEESTTTATDESLKNRDAKIEEDMEKETSDDIELKKDDEHIDEQQEPQQKNENMEDAVTKVPVQEIGKTEIDVKEDLPHNEEVNIENKVKEVAEEEPGEDDDKKLEISSSPTNADVKTKGKEEDEEDEKVVHQQQQEMNDDGDDGDDVDIEQDDVKVGPDLDDITLP